MKQSKKRTQGPPGDSFLCCYTRLTGQVDFVNVADQVEQKEEVGNM